MSAKGKCAKRQVPKPTGRPATITTERIARMREALIRIPFRKHACVLAGIPRPDFYRWLTRGIKARAANDTRASEALYVELANAVDEAVAEKAAQLWVGLSTAPDWRLPARQLEMLDRRFSTKIRAARELASTAQMRKAAKLLAQVTGISSVLETEE